MIIFFFNIINKKRQIHVSGYCFGGMVKKHFGISGIPSAAVASGINYRSKRPSWPPPRGGRGRREISIRLKLNPIESENGGNRVIRLLHIIRTEMRENVEGHGHRFRV